MSMSFILVQPCSIRDIFIFFQGLKRLFFFLCKYREPKFIKKYLFEQKIDLILD